MAAMARSLFIELLIFCCLGDKKKDNSFNIFKNSVQNVSLS